MFFEREKSVNSQEAILLVPTGVIIFFTFKIYIMAIVKVVEVIASSETSIEDALQSCVAEVGKTVRNIDSVYVKDIKAHVKDGKISSYGLICKVSFRVED